MAKMIRAENEVFKNYYTGKNGSRTVNAILDDNCVRYMVFINSKLTSRHEYDNNQKERCLKMAEKALNK